MLKNTNKNILEKILFFILIISFIYVLIGVILLFPYFKVFLKDGYIISPSDLPNYSSLFDSIFSVIAIMSSAILGIMVYRVTENQVNIQYNSEIAGSSEIIYTSIKFKLLHDLANFFEENKEGFKDEEYVTVSFEKKNSIESLLNNDMGKLSIVEPNFEILQKVISNISDEKEKIHLIAMLEDMNRDKTLLYIFMDHIICLDDKNKVSLFEENALEWVRIRSYIFSDDIENLKRYIDFPYYQILETLNKLKQPRDIY